MESAEATVIAAIISGAVSLITGGLVSYSLARQKTLSDLRANFEGALRVERREAYRQLWRLTGLLPKYARTEEVAVQRLLQFGVELRDWYFESGGIVLSVESRDSYFALQERVQLIHERHKDEPEWILDEPTREQIRQQCSLLRSALCADLGSRTPPVIGRGQAV